MRKVSMGTRAELVAAPSGRYVGAARAEKKRIRDEFVAVTGFHRKHAMRLLRRGGGSGRSGPRAQRRLYDDAARGALIVIWEASDRICGKRLRSLAPLLVEAMERHGHLRLEPEVRDRLLAMSAATIDRALREAKAGAAGRRRRGPVSALRGSIPVRTFSDWSDPAPGFCEVDLVWHSGPTAKGSFVQTLTVTDIATGWTECAPLLVRDQKLLTEVLTEIRKRLPFALLGFDSDNCLAASNGSAEQARIPSSVVRGSLRQGTRRPSWARGQGQATARPAPRPGRLSRSARGHGSAPSTRRRVRRLPWPGID